MSFLRILSSVVSLIALSAMGCTSTPGTPKYNVIRLYNDSTTEIRDIELAAGGSTTMLDRLPPDHSPTSDRGVSPDPATAQVSWRTADGQRMGQDVSIAKQLPPGFRGVIVLVLREDGTVGVKFVPYSELK